jgi:hypothetical protein
MVAAIAAVVVTAEDSGPTAGMTGDLAGNNRLQQQNNGDPISGSPLLFHGNEFALLVRITQEKRITQPRFLTVRRRKSP